MVLRRGGGRGRAAGRRGRPDEGGPAHRRPLAIGCRAGLRPSGIAAPDPATATRVPRAATAWGPGTPIGAREAPTPPFRRPSPGNGPGTTLATASPRATASGAPA